VSAKAPLCANHAFGSRIRQIPEPHQRSRDRRTRSGLWIYPDSTYVRLPASFCYLAAILDAYSRRCVWAGISADG
jgi:transposase InsO family protein